ncbi:MAG: thiosulfate oxidation carrier protein SoxY [Deinococcales bacterium]
MKRRKFLALSLKALGLSLAASQLPQLTLAQEGEASSLATTEEHADLMGPVRLEDVEDIKNLNIGLKRVLQKSYEDLEVSDVIRLEAPEYAENGDKVAVEIHVSLPLEEIKAIHLFTDRNPQPYMHVLSMTPEGLAKDPRLGELYLLTVIRLAEAAPIRAIVESQDGRLLASYKATNVGSGGCGAPA